MELNKNLFLKFNIKLNQNIFLYIAMTNNFIDKKAYMSVEWWFKAWIRYKVMEKKACFYR